MNATGPILRQGLVMALVFLAFNLLLWGTEGRTVVFTRMQRIEAEAGRADFVAFGSSLVEAAIAPDSFARSWKGGGPGRILNAGIGASTGIERYIIARRVASLARPGTVFFVGIKSLELADLRFAADRTFSWWDNFGNKSLGFHFDRQVAANLYTGGSPWKTPLFHLFSHLPFLTERAATWGRVERLRRAFGGLGLPEEAVNRFGRVRDFAQISPNEVPAFEDRCRRCVEEGDPLDHIARRMLSELTRRENPVVLMVMPQPSPARKRLYAGHHWAEYLRLLGATLSSKYGARLVDASDWIPDDSRLWNDPMHLSPEGAEMFSARLAQELAVPMAPHPTGISP